MPEPPARKGSYRSTGSGNGYVASWLPGELEGTGMRVALLRHTDEWLNLPPVRFSREDPAGAFYERCIRYEEMCRELVLPLKRPARAGSWRIRPKRPGPSSGRNG